VEARRHGCDSRVRLDCAPAATESSLTPGINPSALETARQPGSIPSEVVVMTTEDAAVHFRGPVAAVVRALAPVANAESGGDGGRAVPLGSY
jgi:hypothetical protein